MIKSISLLCLIVLLFEPISPSSYRRFRRQINSVQNRGSAYDSRAPHAKVPSGSIGGTAYYGKNHFCSLSLIDLSVSYRHRF